MQVDRMMEGLLIQAVPQHLTPALKRLRRESVSTVESQATRATAADHGPVPKQMKGDEFPKSESCV